MMLGSPVVEEISAFYVVYNHLINNEENMNSATLTYFQLEHGKLCLQIQNRQSTSIYYHDIYNFAQH